MRLTYLEVNPLGDGSCSVVTSTDRSFTVPLPLADTITLIEGLESTGASGTQATGDAPAGPAADLARSVGRMLAEGKSLLADRPARHETRLPLFTLTGNAELAEQLLRHIPESAGDSTGTAAADSARPDDVPSVPLLITGNGLDDPAFTAAVRDAENAGRGWLPLLVDRGRFWLGPLLGAGSHLAYSDFRDRLLTNLPPGRTRTGAVALGRWARPSAADLTWVMACACGMLGRLREGFPVAVENHQVELDPATVTTKHHLVLPFPDADGAERPSVAPGTHTPEDLVDATTGVITEVTRVAYPSCIPSGLITIHAHVAKIPRVREWQTDPVAAGTSFVSEHEARQAAIGEAVERYAANVVQPHMIREATWDELRAAGEYAVDPDSLVLFSDEQYAAPGFPFAPFTRDFRTYWVRGTSLTEDRPAWLPAQLVYPNWKSTHYSGDAVTNNTFYPGVAAGPNPDFAMASGLEEVIERHATMAWWSHAQPLPSAEVPPHLAAALGRAPDRDTGRQRHWLVPIDNAFGVPVIAGVVEDVREKIITIGFAARPTADAAALKALAEALTLQYGAIDLDRQHGGFRQAVDRGERSGRRMKPWRRDRRYLDDYRADFRDVADLMCQLQVSLDPRVPDIVRPWVDTPRDRRLDELPSLPDRSLATYRHVLESRGYEIFATDITTQDVAAAGLTVVRVLVPGLVPNFAAGLPFLGRGKLAEAAVGQGWRTTPATASELNYFPLPHA